MSAQKKVIVRKIDGSLLWGYLPPSGFVLNGQVELMEVGGRLNTLAISDIKHIAYVRDFNLKDAVEPEQIGRKNFMGRPRGDGLWLRLQFGDGETLEGLAEVGLGFLDAAADDRGVFLTPPDGRGNTQRLYIPRPAIQAMEVLGLVSAPSRRAKVAEKTAEDAQPRLFPA